MPSPSPSEMTPLERAARAAQEADGAYRHESGMWMKEGGLVTNSHWQDIARAVLTAIREPSEAMTERMADAVEAATEIAAGGSIYRPSRLQALAAQAAFIDAVLAEG